MKKIKQPIQGEGVAVFKLVGYVRNWQDAKKFMRNFKVKDNKHYFITRKETCWGTEYDKV